MKIRSALVLTICVLLFAACNVNIDAESSSTPSDNPIVGYWETQLTSGEDIFIEFREDATFTTNLKVQNIPQDDGIYTIEDDVLRLYYVSRNEVDEQTNSPIQGNPISDSIYLYKVIDNKLYLATQVEYDPDRDMDHIIDAQDEHLLCFAKTEAIR